MNIALFSDSYMPTKSGIVTVVTQLRKVLTELGHHVVIVTVTAKDNDEHNDPDVLRVYSIPVLMAKDQYMGFPHKRQVIDFLRKNDVQLIHSHTEFYIGQIAKKVGKALHIPVIETTHTMWEDFYIYYLPFGRMIPVKVIRRIISRMYKNYYAFINVSTKAHDYYKQPFMDPKIPSAVIPNAVDSETFLAHAVSNEDMRELRAGWGIGSEDTLLLFTGRIVEEKRVEELLNICIDIVKKHDNVKAMFVGNGFSLEYLIRKVRKEKIDDKIIFTGFVKWEELHLYYAIANIFITASLSEMHSMTALEALLSHLPVVARKDTSFSDTVFNGRNGYLADTDEELEERILQLVDDPILAHNMGEQSFKISKGFSIKTHGLRTVAFYKAVLACYPHEITDEQLQASVDSSVE